MSIDHSSCAQIEAANATPDENDCETIDYYCLAEFNLDSLNIDPSVITSSDSFELIVWLS